MELTRRQKYPNCRIVDKEYQKIKRAKGLVNKTQEYRDWREKNPKGSYAHGVINHLIKIGKIKRGKCELKDKFCSNETTQAHHENYDEPLNVRWLCPSHHKKVDLGIIKLLNKTKKI